MEDRQVIEAACDELFPDENLDAAYNLAWLKANSQHPQSDKSNALLGIMYKLGQAWEEVIWADFTEADKDAITELWATGFLEAEGTLSFIATGNGRIAELHFDFSGYGDQASCLEITNEVDTFGLKIYQKKLFPPETSNFPTTRLQPNRLRLSDFGSRAKRYIIWGLGNIRNATHKEAALQQLLDFLKDVEQKSLLLMKGVPGHEAGISSRFTVAGRRYVFDDPPELTPVATSEVIPSNGTTPKKSCPTVDEWLTALYAKDSNSHSLTAKELATKYTAKHKKTSAAAIKKTDAWKAMRFRKAGDKIKKRGELNKVYSNDSEDDGRDGW